VGNHPNAAVRCRTRPLQCVGLKSLYLSTSFEAPIVMWFRQTFPAGTIRPTISIHLASVIPFRLDQLPWSRFHLLVVWILDGLEITIVGSLGPALQSVLSDADHTDGRVVFDFLFCLGSREFRLFDGQRDLSARNPLSHASTHWARPSAEVRRRSGLAGSSSLVRPGA
jgi:hypothetical protein